MTANLTVLYQKLDDGTYMAKCPDIRGCIVQGDTFEEAQALIAQVAQDFLSHMDECDQEDYATDHEYIISKIKVEV